MPGNSFQYAFYCAGLISKGYNEAKAVTTVSIVMLAYKHDQSGTAWYLLMKCPYLSLVTNGQLIGDRQ